VETLTEQGAQCPVLASRPAAAALDHGGAMTGFLRAGQATDSTVAISQQKNNKSRTLI
jgi:hypothetical protein